MTAKKLLALALARYTIFANAKAKKQYPAMFFWDSSSAALQPLPPSLFRSFAPRNG
jgi:hypothetical protein